MNSVSPSAVQYIVGGGAHEDKPSAQSRRHNGQGSVPDGLREGSGEPDEVDRLKAKFMSAWNNVKYGWTVKSKTTFNKTSPLVLLGQSYLFNSEDEVDGFRQAFVSCVWLTYRREFPQLEGSSLTTDCGWGCMLRSGQMLLAQGLLQHLMPPDWRWAECHPLTDVDFEVLKPRSPSRPAGMSLPSFSSSWTSPISQRDPSSGSSEGHRRTPGGCPAASNEPQVEALHRKNILKLKCCIGIIGGKPKHSLFFIGFQDEQLLYLDPHYCQPVVDVTQGNFSLESFHCNSPRKMSFSRMDPSCTIGFYAQTKKDFECLCSAVSEALSSSKEKYPIFTFVEGRGQNYGLEGQSGGSMDGPANIFSCNRLSRNSKRGSTDEFVLL
uniref:Cysteine protease n=1 Tax=Cyprinus carpio TaxID=7962 RepID=A0A8C1VBF3_CYPCA